MFVRMAMIPRRFPTPPMPIRAWTSHVGLLVQRNRVTVCALPIPHVAWWSWQFRLYGHQQLAWTPHLESPDS